MGYKYTIIIPHKNIPHLLKRCIDSIPEREDIKIVIVDDNSNPSIVDFNDFPGCERKNVFHYFSKVNLGGGGARNAGLKYAEGKWLLFADADDFFHNNLSIFLATYYNSDADLIVFDTDTVLSDTLEKTDNRENIVSLYKKEGNDDNILRFCHHTVWGKMFNLNMIEKEGIRFQEVAASNDAFFAIMSGLKSKKVIYDNNIVYCCTVRQGSICTRLTLENIQARIFVVKTINKVLKKNGVNEKYWMNMLGPLFNLRNISTKAFLFAIASYLFQTSYKRIMYDCKESGGRFFNRLKGNVNDKDIKMMQKTK